MKVDQVPLMDELVSALSAAREELKRLKTEDAGVLDLTNAAITRYDLERDRSDLDAATLPPQLVVVVQDGEITGLISDHKSLLVTVIEYIDEQILDDIRPETLSLIPQSPGEQPAPAASYQVNAAHNPNRVMEMSRAVLHSTSFVASSHSQH